MATGTLFRTATKTLPVWQQEKARLARAAEEEGLLGRICARKPWPACWDTEPISFTLGRAAAASTGNAALDQGLTAAMLTVQDLQQQGATKIAHQKIATETVRQAMYANDWELLANRRVCCILPQHEQRVSHTDWPTVFDNLKMLSGQTVSAVVKTRLNSWTSSARFHDQQIDFCIFGCPCQSDNLMHYVQCNRMWRVVRKATWAAVSDDLLDRFGIRADQVFHMKRLAVAFAVYHDLRVEHIHMVRRAKRDGSYRAIAERALATGRVAAHTVGADTPPFDFQRSTRRSSTSSTLSAASASTSEQRAAIT